MTTQPSHVAAPVHEPYRPEVGEVKLVNLLTWLGEAKRLIAIVTGAAFVFSVLAAVLLPPSYTARATLLPPGSQQQSGSAAALAALGSLGGFAGGLSAKTPDELYVALLKSDSVVRALDARFSLKERYKIPYFEALRKAFPNFVRVTADKRSGVITVEVVDKDPAFAAELANAHVIEITNILGRLALSEAQKRRAFFEQRVKETKDSLVKAEADLQNVQERSGVIVLEKQAEALIAGAAQIRSTIFEREVRLKLARISATDQNPEVVQILSELRALRAELARMESARGGGSSSAIDLPVGRLPQAALDYVRARREMKIQETLLEAMVRQLEAARMDEAKEGPLLQEVDRAMPPDYKSKPPRALLVAASTLLALIGVVGWIVVRRYNAEQDQANPEGLVAWRAMKDSWALRR
jgi:capsule polysaccharide export protein KpsE/RkpR